MRARRGFTIIEVLIVIAISTMLATIALTYTSISRNQIALSVETSKVAESILRAKNLAVATYNTSPGTCAYGVYFNIPGNSYSIFAFTPDPAKYGGKVPPCPSVASTTAAGLTLSGANAEMQPYTQGSWNVPIGQGVKLISASDNIVAVIFYPPSPDTLISRDGVTYATSTSAVYLETVDGSRSASVSVNLAGQVNF